MHGDYRFLDGTTQGPGARLWYRASNGTTMILRYVSYQPPERAAMTMTSGPLIFERFSGSWIFKPLGPTQTLVEFQYHFTLRPRLFNALFGHIVARILTRSIDTRLRGLHRFAEAHDPPSTGVLHRRATPDA